MTYAPQYLADAAHVAATFPSEGTTFALKAAADAIFGEDAVAIAAKRIVRRDRKVCEPLQPLTVDYGSGPEPTAYATTRIIFDIRNR